MQPGRKWTVISLKTRLAFQEAALVRDPEVGCGMGQNSAERLKEEWSGRRVALPVLDAQVSEGSGGRDQCRRRRQSQAQMFKVRRRVLAVPCDGNVCLI